MVILTSGPQCLTGLNSRQIRLPAGPRRRPSFAIVHAVAGRPAVVVTGTPRCKPDDLALLAAEAARRLGCHAVAVLPGPVEGQGLSEGGGLRGARHSYGHHLQARRETGGTSWQGWTLQGASIADCLICALDQRQGLLAQLGMTPVAAVVGIERGPVLADDLDISPAVAAGRQAAVMGIPAVVACLATSSEQAPAQPAVDAACGVLEAAAACLQRSGGWPAATNFPRAHFPFPTRGRWALGRELPLPDPAAAHRSTGYAPPDCWALGEDGSWLQRSTGDPNGPRLSGSAEAWRLLSSAFAEGDVFLVVNSPPRWPPAPAAGGGGGGTTPPWAACRPGVLWYCDQVTCQLPGGEEAAAWHRSWQANDNDLFGRSLPSQGYGQAVPTSGTFVGQDNTDAVIARRTGGMAAAGAAEGLPDELEFEISRGTLLSDDATQADVEAVFGGRASVVAVQTWPAGHPFSLRDELLLHHLAEGEGGLPAWLRAN